VTEPDERAVAIPLHEFRDSLSNWWDWDVVEGFGDQGAWVEDGGVGISEFSAQSYPSYIPDNSYALCSIDVTQWPYNHATLEFSVHSSKSPAQASIFVSTDSIEGTVTHPQGWTDYVQSETVSLQYLWLRIRFVDDLVFFEYAPALNNGKILGWKIIGSHLISWSKDVVFVRLGANKWEEDEFRFSFGNFNYPPDLISGQIWDGTKWTYPELWNGTRWVSGHEAEVWNGTRWVPLGRP
jgi:hypothetical protein